MSRYLKNLVVTAGICCGTVPLVAQEISLTVNTGFAIEAITFQSGLGDEKAEIEAEISKTLATEAKRYFGFLTWSDENQSEAALLLKLTSKSKPLGVAINLEYVPQIGDRSFPLQIPPEQLYSEFDEQPKGREEKHRLIDDINEAVVKQFKNDAFREEFHARFIRHIPLSKELEIDVNNQSILIPLSIQQLQAGDGSKLVVEFKAENDAQITQDGSLQLGAPGTRDDRPGWVQCGVIRFWYLPQDHSEWHASIPNILDSPKDLFVYMLKYDADTSVASSSGGAVEDLFGDQQ